MRQFAEQEIIIPDGQYKGQRYKVERQPYAGLWFDAVDSGGWVEHVATGPSQSGKTLVCFVIAVMYHLFEVAETVIVGIPDMDMAGLKWRTDFLPAIESSGFDRLLPERGPGSRGGAKVSEIKFANGVSLVFMSAGGGDKSRAGATTRVLSVTETDGFDGQGGTSTEASKIKQLEARQRSFERPQRRIYKECTVTTEQGHTWSQYQAGTKSRICVPCPRCGEYITPQRGDLKGWQGAETAIAAAKSAYLECNECQGRIENDELKVANRLAVLAHRGQTVRKDGVVVGDAPETDIFGFRWDGYNNQFTSLGGLAADEWTALRDPDADNAERELRQFIWALPTESLNLDDVDLDAEAVGKRFSGCRRGLVPDDCVRFAIGIDTGSEACHWVALAMREDRTSFVVDYGKFVVESRQYGKAEAIRLALEDFAAFIADKFVTSNGKVREPDVIYVDIGFHWHTDAIYAFCHKQSGGRQSIYSQWVPAKGYGASQEKSRGMKAYSAPRKGPTVNWIGEQMHIATVQKRGKLLAHVNADSWKSIVHQSLAQPLGEVRSCSLFATTPGEHRGFVRQLKAEKQVAKWVDTPEGKRELVVWDRTHRNNHYLDAIYYAFAACCGPRKPTMTWRQRRDALRQEKRR